MRTLVAHEESGYEEWGAAGAVRIDPGESGRGLLLTITPSWGATSSGTDRLWSFADARSLSPDSEFEPGQRLEAELGYGLDMGHVPGVVTPYAGLSLSDGASSTWRTRGTLGGEPRRCAGAQGNARCRNRNPTPSARSLLTPRQAGRQVHRLLPEGLTRPRGECERSPQLSTERPIHGTITAQYLG